jgi:hypothetical protein
VFNLSGAASRQVELLRGWQLTLLCALLAVSPIHATPPESNRYFYGAVIGDSDAPVSLLVIQNFGLEGIIPDFYNELYPDVVAPFVESGQVRIGAFPGEFPSYVQIGIHCAGQQGAGWAFNSAAYGGQVIPIPTQPDHLRDLTLAELAEISTRLDLNAHRFDACVQQLDRELERSERTGRFRLRPHPLFLQSGHAGLPVILIGATGDMDGNAERILIGPDYRGAAARLRGAIERAIEQAGG